EGICPEDVVVEVRTCEYAPGVEAVNDPDRVPHAAEPAEVRGRIGHPPGLARVGPGVEVEVERPREEQHRPDRVAGVGDRVCGLADDEADAPELRAEELPDDQPDSHAVDKRVR